MKAVFRGDRSGKAKGRQSFVMLTHQVFHSPAYRHIDCHGKALYVELRSRYNGHNNGRIAFSARDAGDALNISKSAANRAFLQLVDHLLIERQGGGTLLGRLANEWALTEVRNDVTQEPPSKAFLQWRPTTPPRPPKKQKPVPPVGTNVPLVGHNGSGLPPKPDLRPAGGTQDAEGAETASHGRDTYRYLPVHSGSAPSRSAIPKQASEGARASTTNPSDEGLRPLADALAGLRAGMEQRRRKG